MANNSKKRRLIVPASRTIPDDFLVRHAKDVELIFQQAVAGALRKHKLLKNPVAVMKKNRLILIQPDKI